MRTPWVPFGSVFELQRRQVAVDPSADYQEIGVRSFGRGLFVKDPVTGSDIGSKRVFRVEPGDLVVSNVFAWEGAVGVATGLHGGMIGSHRFMTWTPKGDVNVDFARHYFGSELGLTALGAASPGSAGRNRTLSIANLEAVSIPLPPRVEQERIVSHLTAIEPSLIRWRSLSPTLPAALLVAQWLESLPMRRLGTVAQVNPRPVKVAPQTPIDFVPMEAVDARSGTIASSTIRLRGDLSSGYRQFLPGDVIFARITPSMQNGKSAIYLGNQAEVGYGSTEFHILRPHEAVHAEWVWAVLRTRWFIEQAKLAFTGTAGQQRVPSVFLEQVEIPVPEPSQLLSATRRLTGLRERINELDVLGAHRASLSAALLPSVRNEIFNAMR